MGLVTVHPSMNDTETQSERKNEIYRISPPTCLVGISKLNIFKTEFYLSAETDPSS